MEATGVRERLLQEVGEIFNGSTIFGEDLLEIPLGAIETDNIR